MTKPKKTQPWMAYAACSNVEVAIAALRLEVDGPQPHDGVRAKRLGSGDAGGC